MRDLRSNLDPVMLVTPRVLATGNVNGSLDLQGYDSVLLIFAVAAQGVTLASGTRLNLLVRDSNNGTTFANVDDKDVSGDFSSYQFRVDSNGKANKVYAVNYTGSKRYVQGLVTVTGTHSTGTGISVTALRGNAMYRPV